MTMGPTLQIGIIVFIIGAMAFLIWKGGAANPVGTGGLQSGLKELDSKVSTIEGRVEEIDAERVTTKDVERLKEMIRDRDKRLDALDTDFDELRDTINAKLAAIDVLGEKVDRIDKQLPDLVRRQQALGETTSATASDLKLVGKQLDRLYDFIVKKGVES